METYLLLSSDTMKTFTLSLLVVFFVVDSILVSVMLKQEATLDYWYFNWHKKLGLLKMTALKASFLIFQIYCFFDPPLRRSDPILLAWCYLLVVLVMVFKFAKTRRFGGNHGGRC